MEPPTKDERRGVLQAYKPTILCGALAWHADAGLLTIEVVRLAVIALLGTVMGARIWVQAYGRLSDNSFHQVVLALLAISGLTFLWMRP